MCRCWLGVLVALAGVAGACTGTTTDDGSRTSLTTAALTTSSVDLDVGTTSSAVPVPGSVDLLSLTREQLLGLWADGRAAAVQRIVDAGWGVRDNVLHGPGGMTVDLGECPAGWRNDGPAGDAVALGWWTAIHHGSGSSGATAYLEWLGPEATAAGKPIQLTAGWYEVYDGDVFTDPVEAAAQEEANVDLVGEVSAEVLAVVGFEEWKDNDGFRALFDAACLPSLGVLSNELGEPSPWWSPTTQMLIETEANGWAQHLVEEFDGKTAAVLVLDNQWGDRYLDGMQTSLDPVVAGDLVVVRHDPTGVNLDAEIAAIVESGAEVLFLATAGNPCSQAIETLRQAGSEIPIVLPSRCTDYGHLQPVLGYDGLWTLAGTFTSSIQVVADSTLGTAARDDVEGYERWFGADRDWLRTWHAIEILKIAGELPGGLTRTNIALAAWSFEGSHPYAAGPIKIEWATDQIAIEHLQLLQFDSDSELWTLTDVFYQPAAGTADATGPDASTPARNPDPALVVLPKGPLVAGQTYDASGPNCGHTIRLTVLSPSGELSLDSGRLQLDGDSWSISLTISETMTPGAYTVTFNCILDDRGTVDIRNEGWLQITTD